MENIYNYIDNSWVKSTATEFIEVINPATQELLTQTPLSSIDDVERAALSAANAFNDWKRTPVTERVQYLFKLKNALDDHFEELSRLITIECGKTLEESHGEMRRAIENVEIATGMPILMQGYNNEDIARGIDEFMIRQPVGVCAAICPFNFPGMIPFWFMPYALACGNTYIVKPSEKVPLTMQRIFSLIDEIGFPSGVVNLVNGTKSVVDGILDHPAIRAVSFVGSTMVAKYIYSRSTANGKRAQCQGGAKNPIVIMPDADMEMTTKITADSAFGCAGQRCAAASVAITVGEARDIFTESICDAAASRVTGYGLDDGVQMGPVITTQSKSRINELIGKSQAEGATVPIDGRNPTILGYEQGNFVRPTILVNVPPEGGIANTEIFGPVLGLIHTNTLEDAMGLVNNTKYGNMACIFTSNGSAARKFRNEAEVGDVGVNVGIAAPMAFFPFSGWKDSFFGDLHGQGWDAVEFFTQKKVVIERWPKEWSRKF
ncbi:MAG: methylmalonate-semialdehyde dehydrogenase (acylating) [Chloroflexi bacterium RBG_16_47_49]|nr:MAG: methylmalonate-semialdehyde dehydrogenase (acylating) [Chloroflexi bacterium RBG_16_47_49]